jgi:hypothetical protein
LLLGVERRSRFVLQSRPALGRTAEAEEETMRVRSRLLGLWLAFAVAAPAYADMPNGGSPSEGGGSSDDDQDEDDGGCSVSGVAPLAAASMSGVALVGLALAGGVRRRTRRR